MSDTDSFIEEVTEAVRRDRLFALMRRYGWIAILAVILLVGGAAWNEWRKAREVASAQAFGDALLSAMAESNSAKQQKRIAAIATNTAEQRALLAFVAAADLEKSGDAPAAARRLAAVAADATLPQGYRDLAELKRVMGPARTAPAAERLKALAPLMNPGAPYRSLAMEARALILIGTGDRKAAIKQLRDVLNEPQLTSGLRRRATELIVALGADPAAA